MAASSQDSRDDKRLREDLIALARRDLSVFIALCFYVLHDGKGLVHAPYIDLIVEALDCSTQGGERRLIFNLPPGYMKSMIVSVFYTAYRLGVNPSEKIIAISYGPALTHDLSRKTRTLMESPLYKMIFPQTVLDKKSEELLTTTKGGQRYATYVHSAIAGFRADLIVMDDPMQPDEAASENAKQKLRDWYYDVVEQRLLDPSTGVIILVMHRLAPDDLTATFKEAGGWFNISLPLIAEIEEIVRDCEGRVIFHRLPGEPLNPARASIAVCQEIKRKTLPHVWDAQFQQRPKHGGSGLCDVTRFARYTTASKYELQIVIWDIAATKGGGDHTACVRVGLTHDPVLGDVLDILGIIRMQIELPDVRAAIITQDRIDRPALIVIDGNGIGLSIYQDLRRAGMRHLVRGGAMETVNAANIKTERFRRALLTLYDGKIRFPVAMQGLDILMAEMAAFPDGKNDDLVDCLSFAGAHFEKIIDKARRTARGDTV